MRMSRQLWCILRQYLPVLPLVPANLRSNKTGSSFVKPHTGAPTATTNNKSAVDTRAYGTRAMIGLRLSLPLDLEPA